MMKVEDGITGVSEYIGLQSADAVMTRSVWSGMIARAVLWCWVHVWFPAVSALEKTQAGWAVQQMFDVASACFSVVKRVEVAPHAARIVGESGFVLPCVLRWDRHRRLVAANWQDDEV